MERHIAEYSVTDFMVGHDSRFDFMAVGAAIAYSLTLPYHPADRAVGLSPGCDHT